MARTKGALGAGEAERRLIRIALASGEPISSIAAGIGRTRQFVWRQIKTMRERGDFALSMLPLGDDVGADRDKT